MTLLGTSKTLTTGVSPGVTPSVSLAHSGLGAKLRLDLGAEVIVVSLGADPRTTLEALRDDLDRLLTESKEAA